ncbi:MAG: VanZ family protein [Sedimentisphaerales bacterium]|nr:VanZ family protein [Sedimentisphaerales bacterium]
MLKLDNYFNIKWLVIAVIFTSIIILLTHIPQKVMPPRLQEYGLDKLYHVFAYGVITFLFILSLKESSSLLYALLLFCAILAIGIIDEVTQPLVNRQASLADLVANIIGVVTVLLLFMACKYQFQKTKTE